MESEYQLNKFLNLIKKELQLGDVKPISINEILNKITCIFSSVTQNESMENFNFSKNENITFNSIYMISLTKENNPSLVLKIRREDAILPFEKEKEKLQLLQNIQKIPKQFFNTQQDNLKISIEEYISVPHITEFNAYDEKILKILIQELAEVNSQEIIQVDFNNTTSRKYFYMEFLFTKTLPKSIERFKILSNPKNYENIKEYAEYFNENISNFQIIQNFLNEAEKHFEILFLNSNKNYLCLSLIDIHNENFFLIGERIKFIDFEDVSYNFIGYDFANYLLDCDYTFNHDIYPFYYFLKIFDLSIENVKGLFNEYIDVLNRTLQERKSEIQLEYLGEVDIAKLFVISLVKGIIEYVFMIKDNYYTKDDIDFTLLIVERIKLFEYYFKIIKNNGLD